MNDPTPHRRRSVRLRGYDYAQAGAYFVTICAHNRVCRFGAVADGEVQLNEEGQIVLDCWAAIPQHCVGVELDESVVMPNHVHGLIVLTSNAVPLASVGPVGATDASPLPPGHPTGPAPRSLAAVVGSFKAAVTKRINEGCGRSGTPVWQRNYYEHVIRKEESLSRIRQYIIDNPARWEFDRENPGAHDPEP